MNPGGGDWKKKVEEINLGVPDCGRTGVRMWVTGGGWGAIKKNVLPKRESREKMAFLACDPEEEGSHLVVEQFWGPCVRF